ncbi:MAG TPA: hypothetical protein ENK57_02965, partial [Polyangiaceae bacterium]|nr:hypothetical protein [Polyangiaceae bacterium]
MSHNENDASKPYREDLEAARYRVNTLEAELREKEAALEARDAAIDELHKELDRSVVAKPQSPRRWPWIVGLVGLVLGGMTTLMLLLRRDAPPPAASEPPRTAPEAETAEASSGRTYLWQGQPRRDGPGRKRYPPTVADVNGDDVPDVIGMVTTVGTEGRAFAGAFDGSSGEPLWLSEELAWMPEGLSGAFMTTEGDTVIATTTKGELLAIDQRTGRTFERVTIGTAQEICHTDDGVTVVAKDGVVRVWDSSTRAFRANDAARCPDLHERLRQERRASKGTIPAPPVDGVEIVKLLAHGGRAYALVAAGRMKQPEVIAYEPSSQHVVWRAPATGDREQLAKPPFHAGFGVADGCVFVEVQHATMSARGP